MMKNSKRSKTNFIKIRRRQQTTTTTTTVKKKNGFQSNHQSNAFWITHHPTTKEALFTSQCRNGQQWWNNNNEMYNNFDINDNIDGGSGTDLKTVVWSMKQDFFFICHVNILIEPNVDSSYRTNENKKQKI